jgi:hypothetical protein
MRRFDGTLHRGNLCNNNYKLTMALRAIDVDARILLFERIIAQNAVSDPADYDSQFDPLAEHVLRVSDRHRGVSQKIREALAMRRVVKRRCPGYWVHAQSEYPMYVQSRRGFVASPLAGRVDSRIPDRLV